MSAPVPVPAEAVAAAARALPAGVRRSRDVKADGFARVLLLGAAKIGKTTCLLETAPKPLIINCDGDGATQYAATGEAEFLQVDATSVRSWGQAQRDAKALVESGDVRTIILDTVSLLSEALLSELSLTLDGFDKWNALYDAIVGGYKRLATLQAHLFTVSHMDPREDEISGIMPLLPGKAKAILPALCADWVLLDYDASRTGKERAFLLGPQKSWTHSGRNVSRSIAVPANVPALFTELGITP